MTEDPRMLAAWAENAAVEVRRIRTIPELDAWIVTHNQKLGLAHQHAPSAWNELRRVLHAQDGVIRDGLRQGVG